MSNHDNYDVIDHVQDQVFWMKSRMTDREYFVNYGADPIYLQDFRLGMGPRRMREYFSENDSFGETFNLNVHREAPTWRVNE